VSTPLPDPPPEVGIHRKRSHLAGYGVKESAMMDEPAVPEESRQHGQSARRERLIDEGLLPFERLDRGTTGQQIFARRCISNLRIELADRSQPFGFSAVSAVERLAQHKLPARRIVAEIEPIRDIAQSLHHALLNDTPRRPCVHAADEKVGTVIMVRPKCCLIEANWLGIPLRSPEQVDAVDENCRLVLAHVGPGERLPDAVGLGNRVAIHEGDFETIGMPPRPHRLVQIRQAHHNGAPRATRAHHQNPHEPATEEAGREKMLDTHGRYLP